MAEQCYKVPVQENHLVCTVTPPWMLCDSEYKPTVGTFKFLNCGEEAFGEIHKAIVGATKSICILTWAFQSSMKLVRNGKGLEELLREKARSGVKVRVLCFEATSLLSVAKVALNNISSVSALWDKETRKELRNFEFCARNFIAFPRSHKAYDEDISFLTWDAQNYPSLHQKMVLVDYEIPEKHVGFIMGHNLKDVCWDTVKHPYKKETAGREDDLPWQDLSCKVTGPIIEGLFRNFSQMWSAIVGKTLRSPSLFSKYPLRSAEGEEIFGQILRTYRKSSESIKRSYLNAIRQASTSIYIENQYFRWLPLAEAIKKAAVVEFSKRDPAKHGLLYLFVVTNSSDASLTFLKIDGTGGTGQTYDMLDSLGRSDTLPEIGLDKTEDRRKELEKELKKTNKALEKYDRYSDTQPGWRTNPKMKGARDDEQALVDKKGKLEKELQALKAKREKLESAQKGEIVQPPEEHPGLKVHICTLVPPDMPAGKPWTEILTHSKLMIVNDSFLTIGSANINTRSMQTDFELNIAIQHGTKPREIRKQLWANYTNGKGAQDNVAEAFKEWGKIIKENRERESNKQRPIASLRGFLRLGKREWGWARID